MTYSLLSQRPGYFWRESVPVSGAPAAGSLLCLECWSGRYDNSGIDTLHSIRQVSDGHSRRLKIPCSTLHRHRPRTIGTGSPVFESICRNKQFIGAHRAIKTNFGVDSAFKGGRGFVLAHVSICES